MKNSFEFLLYSWKMCAMWYHFHKTFKTFIMFCSINLSFYSIAAVVRFLFCFIQILLKKQKWKPPGARQVSITCLPKRMVYTLIHAIIQCFKLKFSYIKDTDCSNLTWARWPFPALSGSMIPASCTVYVGSQMHKLPKNCCSENQVSTWHCDFYDNPLNVRSEHYLWYWSVLKRYVI